MQFLLLVLELVETIVDTALRQQFLVRSLLAEAALVENENAVRVLYRTQTMRDYEGGAAGKQAVEGFADLEFGLGVQAGGGFIKN